MLQFNIKSDFRTFKKDQEFIFDLDELLYIVCVGPNGCGKSTLFQALRAKFPRKKELNLNAPDLKKLLDFVEIQTDYKQVHFLDTDFDNMFSMNNTYDACAFVNSGGFGARTLSNGQKQLRLLGIMLEKLKPATEKSLIVLDEIDSGFDLTFQKAYTKVAGKLMSMNYHVIMISHSPLVMIQSKIVYDLELALNYKKPLVSANEYLKEKIGLDIKVIKEQCERI